MRRYVRRIASPAALFAAALLLMALFFSGCANMFNHGSTANGGTLAFNLTGAVALAGSSDQPTRSVRSTAARTTLSPALDKILSSGLMTPALTASGGPAGWQPQVSFIGLGADKSVYVCFQKVFTAQAPNGRVQNVQFVRVDPSTNSYQVLWPITPVGANATPPTVNTWSWPGSDNNSMVTGPNGKIYFETLEIGSTATVANVYSYDPAAGGGVTLLTPTTSTDVTIGTFAVDKNGDLFVQGGNSAGTEQWFKAYTPGSAGVHTIFDTTNPTAVTAPQLNSYTADPNGNSVIFSGRNIAGLTGIVRASVDTTGTISYSLLYGNPNGGSAFIDLVQVPANDNPTAIVDQSYDSATNTVTYSWDPTVLTGGSPDQSKILTKVSAYYYGGATVTDSSFLTTDLNAGAPNSLGNEIEMRPSTFLSAYFSGTLFSDYLSANNLGTLNFDYLGQFFWDSTGALYASYSPAWWQGASNDPGRVLKLLDSNGNLDLKSIPLAMAGELPEKVKYVNGDIYYEYSILDGSGQPTGADGIDRFSLASMSARSGVEASVLTDPAIAQLAPSGIAIGDYDVSPDGSTLYFSGTNQSTNAPLFGEVDLSTMKFTDISASGAFNMVRAF